MAVGRGFDLPIDASGASFGPLAYSGNSLVQEATTTTQITVGGAEVTYTGTGFVFGEDGLLEEGNITGLFVDTPIGPFFELTDADADAGIVASFIRDDDYQGYIGYLFRGDDVLTGSTQRDVLSAVGGGNDRVFGRDGDDALSGGDGDDALLGEAGRDRLNGEAGNDRLFGGEGNDRVIGGDGNDNLVGGPGNDRGLGGDGNDRLAGNAGNERLVGGNGMDTLLGGAEADTLIGGADDDRLLGAGGNDLMRGNLGDDLLNGGAGNDRQFGGDGSDSLNGQGGNDVIRGGQGDDVIRGGSGNDRLSGELGNDRIETGDGRDRIVIRPGQGNDTVTDFANGFDRIVLGRISFEELSFNPIRGGVQIALGSENLLFLAGVTSNQIGPEDFV